MTETQQQLPCQAGLGLKPQHYREVLAGGHDIGFFEVHAENYMGEGGPPHRYLEEIVSKYPLSIHGVGLSIGGQGPLDRAHLQRLKSLLARYRPASFSEHLAWSTHDNAFLNDLLPLPYTPETLARVCAHVDEVQQVLGCRMLLENPATYVVFVDSDIDEVEFLAAVAEGTGCGLLLDVNNVMVSCVNHGCDPYAYVEGFPLHQVGEIHLAGYDETTDSAGERLLIDAHGSPVRPDVFVLFEHTIEQTGPLPVLVEWDNNVPAFQVLTAEVRRVNEVLQSAGRKMLKAAS